MKLGTKIALVIITCVILVLATTGVIGYLLYERIAHVQEYRLGDDVIPSINAVLGEGSASSIFAETKNGITTTTIVYQSPTVQEDLASYVQYLEDQEGFILTQDMDLNQVPSSVQMGKTSVDPGEVIILTVDYDHFGYTITLKKGEGQLNMRS